MKSIAKINFKFNTIFLLLPRNQSIYKAKQTRNRFVQRHMRKVKVSHVNVYVCTCRNHSSTECGHDNWAKKKEGREKLDENDNERARSYEFKFSNTMNCKFKIYVNWIACIIQPLNWWVWLFHRSSHTSHTSPTWIANEIGSTARTILPLLVRHIFVLDIKYIRSPKNKKRFRNGFFVLIVDRNAQLKCPPLAYI